MSNASGDDTPKEDGQELLRLLIFNEYRVGFARGAKNDDSEWAAKASEYRARLARHIARLEAPVSASGDDEELKHLLDALNKATLDASQAEELDEVRDAIKAKREARIAVESLFGRIREERDRLSEDDRALRREWWLSHGCPITSLYGDDGEMGCGSCLIDFKRWPPNDISARLANARRAGSPDKKEQ